MTVQPQGFDPVQFKETTREQWEQGAEAWHRWGPTLQDWLGPVTEAMLELTHIGPGERVLDVAAGAGDPALSAAARVGPTGHVLATDFSTNLLGFAAQRARERASAQLSLRRVPWTASIWTSMMAPSTSPSPASGWCTSRIVSAR